MRAPLIVSLVSAARFINMHGRANVPLENISVAVVVHGGAVKDVSNAAYYSDAVGGDNANAALIAALISKGVRIIVCGQSAAYYDVGNDDLLLGVEMALSAMTAHALLQRDGYTVNPFLGPAASMFREFLKTPVSRVSHSAMAGPHQGYRTQRGALC